MNGTSGYLATFTTQAEQSFVIGFLGGGPQLEYLWLGGYQTPGSEEPYGGWNWITGEAWLGVDNDISTDVPRADDGFNNLFYTPNGVNLGETATITWWGTGGINDFYALDATTSRGFIVEYDIAVDVRSVAEPSGLALVFLGATALAISRRVRKALDSQPKRSLASDPH